MWGSLLKDCAFYYDVPTIEQENKMKKTLQRKYDNLLTPGWRPPLTSRRDLLHWACAQTNATYGANVDPSLHIDCENHDSLVKRFGPDYNRLRSKLGYVKGLFD